MADSDTDTETDTDTATDQPGPEVMTRDQVGDVIDQALERAEERADELDREEMRSMVQDVMNDNTLGTEMPNINPDAGDVSPEARAESDDGAYRLTSQLYRSMVQRDHRGQREVQRQLVEAGHYEGMAGAGEARSEGFETLVDEHGGIFLPTTIADRIYDIEDQVGAISQVATELPMEAGERQKLPNVLGTITFNAVNEFNEVTGQQFNFGGITLDPAKWAALIPWSNEMEEAAGAQLLPILNRKIAIGSARFKDDVVLNGDGGSAYHGFRGIFQRADDGDITQRAADSGASSFSALTATDWLKLQLALPASIRSMGVYVTHPDRRYDILELQTSNDGFYFYQPDTESNNLSVDRLWGRPIYYTDQHPNTDSSSEPYATYFHPDYLAFGRSNSLSTKRLDQATITDPDGNELRLAAQFAQALRIREDADFEFGLENAFAEGQLA